MLASPGLIIKPRRKLGLYDFLAHQTSVLDVPYEVYYVDSGAGDDANDGRDPTAPWETITKVNASTFQPGDYILFKSGETWTEQPLLPPSAGRAGAPITFGAYGAGARPIFDGNLSDQRVIYCQKSYINFRGIHATQGTSYGFDFASVSYVNMFDCEASVCGDDNISLTSVDQSIIQDCVSYDAYRNAGGPTISNIEIQDGCSNVLVDGCECYGSEEIGINIMGHASPAVFPYNITVTDCNVHDNDKQGIIVWNSGDFPTAQSITITDCTIQDNGAGVGIYGLYIFSSGGDGDPNNVTVTGCKVAGSTSYQMVISGDGHEFQRNVVVAEPHGVLITDATNLEFFNNTIYNAQASGSIIAVTGTTNTSTAIRSNIFYTSVAALPVVNVAAGADSGLTFDYNLYYHVSGVGANRWIWTGSWYSWANWKTNSSQDGNSPTPADPTFTNAGAEDFTLQAGSPAINTGTDLGNGDDCGRYQYTG